LPEAEADLTIFNLDLSLEWDARSDPSFELHIVLWDEGNPSPQELTLCEFSRDLAEVARNALRSEPSLARRMGKIRCLRMDPRCFENRLWQVWEI